MACRAAPPDRMSAPWRCLWALMVLSVLPGAAAAAAPKLIEIVATPGVQRGRPIASRTEFSFEDKQMYVWLHVRSADLVELRWYRDDAYVVGDALKPTGAQWRTWVRRRFRDGDAGRWRVEVWTKKAQLGQVEFTVGEVGAPRDPIDRPPTPPPIAPQTGDAPAIDLVEPIPRRAPPRGCHALINFRVSEEGKPPRYAVADVQFDEAAELHHAQGLVIADAGGAMHALEVRRREYARRAWDEVISAPIRGEGTPRRWLHLPGAQPLPAPAELREDNRLTVLSIIGPYVGFDASMRSAINGERTDNSRYLTADAMGALIDLRQLVGVGLEMMVAHAGGAGDFDYRRMALVPEGGLIALFAASRIPLLSPPPALRPFSPDRDNVWRNGRCAVKLAGHRIAAGVDDAPMREIQAPRLLPYAILGVHWLDASQRSPLDELRSAQRRIARVP